MIVLIAHSFDRHTLIVQHALNQQHIENIRISAADLASTDNLSLSFSNHAAPRQLMRTHTAGQPRALHNLQKATTIWNRRPFKTIMPDDMHPEDKPVAQKEFDSFAASAWGTLAPNATWINPWQSQQLVENKGRQLSAARQTGFQIPDTLMSNDPEQIREFARQHQSSGIIFKCFNPISYELDNGRQATMPTTPIDADDLDDDYALINCPGIYQPRIEKAYELRVTMFGEYPVAAKIDSQNTAKGKDDWRLDQHQAGIITPYILPEPVKSACIALMRQLGLAFGCIDLIVTPSGDYIFLEINHMGQFLWVEDACPDIPMLDIFTQYLTRPTRDFAPSPAKPTVHLADVFNSAAFDNWSLQQQQGRTSPFKSQATGASNAA